MNEGLVGRAAGADLPGPEGARAARRPVEVAIRDLGVDEVALVAAIRRKVRVPLADPASVSVDPDALRTLSRDSCRRLKVFPLSLGGWGEEAPWLDLAMADPTDERAIAEVEEATGCRASPALMTLSAIEELVESAYGAFVTEVMRRDPRMQTAPVAPAPQAPPAEASLAIRHRALLELLLDKGLVEEAEYEAAVARVIARERES